MALATVSGGRHLSKFFRELELRPGDILYGSNSGGRHSGYGRINGLRAAMVALGYPQYASGVIPANCGGTDDVAGAGDTDGPSGSGWSGPGDGWYEPGGTNWLTDGAPAGLNKYMPGRTSGAATGIPDRYLFMTDSGASIQAASHQRGLAIATTHPFFGGPSTQIRYDFTYGKFSGDSDPNLLGHFRASVFAQAALANSGQTATASDNDIDELADAGFSYTHSAAVTKYLHATYLNAALNATMRGAVFFLYRRLVKPSITRGFGASLYFSLGGVSARAQAIAMGIADPQATIPGVYTQRVGMTAEMRRERMRQCVRQQIALGYDPMLLMKWNEGLNQQNELYASVGPLAVSDGDSAEAYIDSTHGGIIQARADWAYLGYRPENLFHLINVDFALNPDTAKLISYRSISLDFAAGQPDVAAVDVTTALSGAAMEAAGYYLGPGEQQAHLSDAGYDAVELAEMTAVRAAALKPAGGLIGSRGRGRGRGR